MTRLNRRHVLAGADVAAFTSGFALTSRAAGSASFTATIRNIATDRTQTLPDGGTSAAPISPGDKLQFATMFVQSNDLFFAPRNGGIALFDAGGRAIRGKVTRQIVLFDAGTEVNQAPGVGPGQVPRQAKPDTGTAERVGIATVADRRDGFAYPPAETVIDVEIMPLATGQPQG